MDAATEVRLRAASTMDPSMSDERATRGRTATRKRRSTWTPSTSTSGTAAGAAVAGCWSLVLWFVIIGLLAEAWQGSGVLLRSFEIASLLALGVLAIAVWAAKRTAVK
jgi:hypothetical protein